ncbi:MAG TPA: hypothetical protein VMJ10_26515 [Kofleriaceae bacterium]|nr:hypothetical protein [Kofleriaceae bacterium]
MMDLRERANRVRAWLAARTPRQLLLAGWVTCILLCYPGYLSFDSIEQLGQARSGHFTDAYAPVMTGVWSLCEWIFAGPFPMLALQTGLFVFGAYGVLKRALSPRAAAVVAVGVLAAPPVFAPMAVIWPDSLMAGALLAAAAALLDERRAMKAAGAVALVIAGGCRPEVAPATIPLAMLALPASLSGRLRRAGLAVALVVACSGVARLVGWILVDDDTYAWQQRLEWIDVVGTLRRAHADDPMPGLTVVDRARLLEGHDAYDAYVLTHGPKRVAEPIADDAQSEALSAAWHAAIADHFGAYATHRGELMLRQLGITHPWLPVFDDFGDPDHLMLLHHRATPSDLEIAWRAIVHVVALTPLFRPLLYVLLAIPAIVLARRRRELLALVASGVMYEIIQLPLASSVDYRFSHWLVATVWLVLVALAVARKPAWRAS